MEDPGTRFRYSEATTVLGRLVEVWSGQKFDAFVTARVLRPLGMTDTSFWVEPDARPRLVTVYQSAQGGPLCALRDRRGAVHRTAEADRRRGRTGVDRAGLPALQPDAAQQGRAWRRPVDQRQDRRDHDRERPAARGSPAARRRDGLGSRQCRCRLTPNPRGYLTSVGEYGWDGSAGTFFAIDPARETVVILMTQSVPASPDGVRQKFKALVDQSVVTAMSRRFIAVCQHRLRHGRRHVVPATQEAPGRAPRNAAEFDALFQQIKNWGRWGAERSTGLGQPRHRRQAQAARSTLARTGSVGVALAHRS